MSNALVKDTCAESGAVRIHEIITRFAADGKTPVDIAKYRLGSDTGLEMPMDHAMQFLKDKAFIVTDMQGNRIEPIPVQKDGGTGSLVLNANEVICTLEELKTSSLYKRCKAQAGASRITEESSREDMIAFLTDRATPEVSIKSDVALAVAAAGVDTMDVGALNKLFGDD